jgi:hypothetical protein
MKFGPYFHAGALVSRPHLYHYAAGTTTLKTAWTDRGRQVTAPQPIVGNGDGVISGYFEGLYKLLIYSGNVDTDPNSILLEQWDNVQIGWGASSGQGTGEDIGFVLFTDLWSAPSFYDTLAEAVTAAGSEKSLLVVTIPISLTQDLHIPKNIQVWAVGGGFISVSSTFTLSFDLPDQLKLNNLSQIFSALGGGTIRFLNAGIVYPEWWGAIGDNATASQPGIQAAHDALPASGTECGTIMLSSGRYKMGQSLTLSKDGVRIQGAGLENTVLDFGNATPGLPGIHLNGELAFVDLKDFKLEGNYVTGASGNGHGISMLDPTPESGAFAPQQCVIERVQVIGFRGLDSDGRGGSMVSAGIAQVSTLENTIRLCRLDQCGIGLHIDSCYTPRLYENIIIDNDKYGIQALGTEGIIENLFAHGNDILNNGDGTTVNQTGWAGAPTGNVYLFNVSGGSLIGNKFKTGNLGNVMAAFCQGMAYAGNFIRANEQYGMILRCPRGAEITGNHFDCTNSIPNNAEYLTIQALGGQDACGVDVRGNIFRFQGGATIAHCIKIEGDSNARKLVASKIEANEFGDKDLSGACTVTNGITVINITLDSTKIVDNDFFAETNATISCCFRTDANVVFGDTFKCEDNTFRTAGGVITAQFAIAAGGFTQRLKGTGDPNGAVTAYQGSQFERRDGGAGTSFYVNEGAGWSTTWAAK